MQLVGIQFDIAWEDREKNFAKVTAMLEKSPPQKGAIVALPEMFATGFSMNVDKIAEEESSASEKFLQETAKRHEIFLIASIPTAPNPSRSRLSAPNASIKPTNTAIVVDPTGTILTRYNKIHPFGKEADHYTAGNQITTFKANDFRVTPFICYDLRFPEIFRIATTRGTNLFIVIASWPTPRADHWTTLLKARAIENQSYVLGVNRCGKDPYLPYPGQSVIYDPTGKILAQADDGEQIISAEANIESLNEYRKQLPFLNDMRKEFLRLSD